MAGRHADPDSSTFVCPITNGIFEEPMLADDGCTYSKHAILSWFKSCHEQQRPIISPCSRQPISENLVPNSDIVKSIEEYQKRECSAGEPAVDATLASKSLAELGTVFSLLDGLRQLLTETLDGWQTPQIVVVGQESSGKSSVLERLMMTPLLPRADNICTRLPIHVRLRRSDKAMPPRLEVYNTLTKTTEKGPYVIAAMYGDLDVKEEMRRILTEEQGSLRGVSSSRIIILHVTNPDVPFLDLVDMPGLVSVPSGNEPSDLASQTLALVKGHIQSEHGANSLYLAVVKATIAPNISVALQLLHEADVCEKTFGVFTFCDELGRKNARRLEQWVRKPQDGQGAVALEPWGWVATTNAPPEDRHGNAVVYANNCARLRAQAAEELSTLRDMQLGQLLDDGYASHAALVSRLNRMFLDHLKSTWAPKTLRMLASEQKKLAYQNALLGMPASHEANAPPLVKRAIAQEVKKVLERGAPTLVQQYARSLQVSLQREIQHVVHKAIQDAFPAEWLPSGRENDTVAGVVGVAGVAGDVASQLVVPLDSFDQIFEQFGLEEGPLQQHQHELQQHQHELQQHQAELHTLQQHHEEEEQAEKGRQPEEYGRVPDTYGALVHVCKSALLDASTDAAFWDEGVRALFPAPLEEQEQLTYAAFWDEGVRALFPAHLEEQEQPLWPSAAAQDIVDRPAVHVARRFPGLIDSVVEMLQGELKTKSDALILDAVSRRVAVFSSELAAVDRWRKTFSTDAVEIVVVEAGSVTALTNDIVLIFLRYKRGMLRELTRSSVIDRLVGGVSLRESCAEQRLELAYRVEAMHRAKEGIFELLGLTRQEDAWPGWVGVCRSPLKKGGGGFL